MNRFLKGAMILTLAGLIVKVIGALSKVFIARILGGEGIGLYQMAYPIYQIIVAIAASIRICGGLDGFLRPPLSFYFL